MTALLLLGCGRSPFSPNKGIAEYDLPPLEKQTGRSDLVSEILGHEDSVPGFLPMLEQGSVGE